MNIEHIALNVSDPVAMADWWVKHLGMRIVLRVDGPPHTRFIADSAGKTMLEIYAQTVAAVPDYASMHPMALHVAFTAADVKAEHARLLAAGATDAGKPNVAPNGDELAMVRDPWGVCVQLVKRASQCCSRLHSPLPLRGTALHLVRGIRTCAETTPANARGGYRCARSASHLVRGIRTCAETTPANARGVQMRAQRIPFGSRDKDPRQCMSKARGRSRLLGRLSVGCRALPLPQHHVGQHAQLQLRLAARRSQSVLSSTSAPLMIGPTWMNERRRTSNVPQT